MILLLCLVIGLFAGLRSLMAPAITAWAAYLGWLTLERPLSLIGATPSVALFTIAAAGELVLDKLPNAPNRTDALGVGARIATGGLSAACVAASGGGSAWLGAVLGSVGGVVGCFAGYRARTGLVKALGTPGMVVALVEDLVAIAGPLWVVSRF